jgi:hypothetical protein
MRCTVILGKPVFTGRDKEREKGEKREYAPCLLFPSRTKNRIFSLEYQIG